MSYVGMTSERLALSLEDGEIELFWDLDSHPETFLGYITKVLESIEETVSEEAPAEEAAEIPAEAAPAEAAAEEGLDEAEEEKTAVQELPIAEDSEF